MTIAKGKKRGNPNFGKTIGFKKGEFHPNRNLKGRPPVKEIQEFRDLILDALNKTVKVSSDGKITIDRDENEPMRLVDVIVQKMITAKHPTAPIYILDRAFGKIRDREETKAVTPKAFTIPAENIAPDFLDAYRDIIAHKHTEYMFFGGRGSTKSSFVSLAIIYILLNNPLVHALATRQVAATLRDSVYSQLRWAIGVLGLDEQFRCVTNPLEIEYIPTGQKIYFRGADDPIKIKSIKPTFGYLGVLWFEELSEFHGEEVIRSVTQSAIRGGDEAFIFKSYNPSRTANNWVNKYALIPKDTQYQHKSSYLTVPIEWLGKTFIEEADHLHNVNPDAYDHEYLGVVNGTGGQVFQNVKIRKITDDEIAQFDHVLHGLDWGFYPDPNHYSVCHYDAARLTLYIYGEVRAWKTANRDMYQMITQYGYRKEDLIIADSAEPKSVADFREYGANCRGAEKGKDSVKYSMKWLQSLKEIVIDNERCPHTSTEFLDYEFEQTKDGELINAYPDKNNHSIDSIRYATNLIWRRRGE